MNQMPATGRRRRALALLAGVVVVAVAAGIGVATRGGGPSDTTVTPTQAIQVVKGYDRAETIATQRLSIAAQDAVEMPPEAVIDDASFAALHAQGQHTSAPARQTLVRIVAYVPVQRGDSASFAAFVSSRVAGHPGAILMVFHRTGRTGRWRQSMSPAYAGAGSPPAVALGPGGYARALDRQAQVRHLRFTTAAVAADYAGLLELAVRGDRLVSGDPFAAGPFTSQLAASDRQAAAQVAGGGGSASGTAIPATYPTLTLPLRGGGALALFTVSARQTFSAAGGLALQQAANRTPWSPLVPPGSYRQIGMTSLMTVAALVPPRGSSRPVQVVAETASVIATRPVATGGAAIT